MGVGPLITLMARIVQMGLGNSERGGGMAVIGFWIGGPAVIEQEITLPHGPNYI